MATSEEMKEYIKKFEKLKMKAYLPTPKDKWTIGWGTTVYPDGTPVKKGDVLKNEAEAQAYFDHDIKRSEDWLKSHLEVPVNQNQLDALVSWHYNTGGKYKKNGKWHVATLIKQVNRGDLEGATKSFADWNQQAGEVLDGLTKRRGFEAVWFNKPGQTEPTQIASMDSVTAPQPDSKVRGLALAAATILANKKKEEQKMLTPPPVPPVVAPQIAAAPIPQGTPTPVPEVVPEETPSLTARAMLLAIRNKLGIGGLNGQ